MDLISVCRRWRPCLGFLVVILAATEATRANSELPNCASGKPPVTRPLKLSRERPIQMIKYPNTFTDRYGHSLPCRLTFHQMFPSFEITSKVENPAIEIREITNTFPCGRNPILMKRQRCKKSAISHEAAVTPICKIHQTMKDFLNRISAAQRPVSRALFMNNCDLLFRVHNNATEHQVSDLEFLQNQRAEAVLQIRLLPDTPGTNEPYPIRRPTSPLQRLLTEMGENANYLRLLSTITGEQLSHLLVEHFKLTDEWPGTGADGQERDMERQIRALKDKESDVGGQGHDTGSQESDDLKGQGQDKRPSQQWNNYRYSDWNGLRNSWGDDLLQQGQESNKNATGESEALDVHFYVWSFLVGVMVMVPVVLGCVLCNNKRREEGLTRWEACVRVLLYISCGGCQRIRQCFGWCYQSIHDCLSRHLDPTYGIELQNLPSAVTHRPDPAQGSGTPSLYSGTPPQGSIAPSVASGSRTPPPLLPRVPRTTPSAHRTPPPPLPPAAPEQDPLYPSSAPESPAPLPPAEDPPLDPLNSPQRRVTRLQRRQGIVHAESNL